jgi:hypothetical protein
MHRSSFWGLAVLVVIAGLGAARAVGAVRRLPPPDHVTFETRAELDARMRQHGETMSNLIRSVVLLDRPTVRALATRIAEQELISRSSKAMRQLPPLSLPQEFFVQQTALSGAARELAAAAVDGGDDQVLADRFAALTGTCITCHSVYLHGRPEPLEPKGK